MNEEASVGYHVEHSTTNKRTLTWGTLFGSVALVAWQTLAGDGPDWHCVNHTTLCVFAARIQVTRVNTLTIDAYSLAWALHI